jgi:drug/metabolite transporter (DMT)-like permease
VIGGMVLLPFAIRQARIDKFQLNISSILRIGSLGILNVCVSMLLLQLSIFYGKASLTAVIVSMNPLFVSLFAMLLINEKMNKSQIISLAIGVIGLLIIILSEGDIHTAQYRNLNLGIVLAIAASLTFGFYTVRTKKAVLSYGNLLTNSVSFLCGGLVLLLINLMIGKQMVFGLNLRNMMFMGYLGFVITGLAYLLYFEGMKIISAADASAYFFLKPALATLLAYFILKESLNWMQVMGILLIVVSLSRASIIRYLHYPKNRIDSDISTKPSELSAP